jgi:hypothetical protein
MARLHDKRAEIEAARFIGRKIINSGRLLGAHTGSLVLLTEALVIIGIDLLYSIGI